MKVPTLKFLFLSLICKRTKTYLIQQCLVTILLILKVYLGLWRNRQTQWTQNPPSKIVRVQISLALPRPQHVGKLLNFYMPRQLSGIEQPPSKRQATGLSPVRGAIFPGVVQLIERGIWDAEVESLSLSTRTIYSCSQKVRQWTLTPRFVGSIPATSAILMKDSYSKYLIGLLT